MRSRSSIERRRNQRILTPSGMWVSWKMGNLRFTSRVENLSASGAFIAAHEALAVGSRLNLHFSVPEGQIQVQAIVRNVREGIGMGVEFVSMRGQDHDVILKVIKRLLV